MLVLFLLISTFIPLPVVTPPHIGVTPERFWLQRLPRAAAELLSPSLPAAGASSARCCAASPPSVAPLPFLGGWCPEREMTNASASSY